MSALFYVYSGLIAFVGSTLFGVLAVHSSTKSCGMSREKLAGIRLGVFIIVSIAVSGLLIHLFHLDEDIERVYYSIRDDSALKQSAQLAKGESMLTNPGQNTQSKEATTPNLSTHAPVNVYMIKSVNCPHCHDALPTFEDFGLWARDRKGEPKIATHVVEVTSLQSDPRYTHMRSMIQGVPTFIAESKTSDGKRVMRTHVGGATMDQLRTLSDDVATASQKN